MWDIHIYMGAFVDELTDILTSKHINVVSQMSYRMKRAVTTLFVREDINEDVVYIRSIVRKAIYNFLAIEPAIESSSSVTITYEDTLSSQIDILLLTDTKKIPLIWKYNSTLVTRKRGDIFQGADFGESLFGYPFSISYSDIVYQIAHYIDNNDREKRIAQEEITNLYSLFFARFVRETRQICEEHNDAILHFVQYLITTEDHYTFFVMTADNPSISIEAHNYHGSLGNEEIDIVKLPTKIVDIVLAQSISRKSTANIKMILDNNWSIKLRMRFPASEKYIVADFYFEDMPHNLVTVKAQL